MLYNNVGDINVRSLRSVYRYKKEEGRGGRLTFDIYGSGLSQEFPALAAFWMFDLMALKMGVCEIAKMLKGFSSRFQGPLPQFHD